MAVEHPTNTSWSSPEQRTVPAPIFNFPYELLETIFQYSVSSEATDFFLDSFASLSLSHVCNSWRSVTHTSPRLWSIGLCDWLYTYLRNGDIKEISVKMSMSGVDSFLKAVSNDLPWLKWVDLYGWLDLGSDCSLRVEAPLPFLRSLLFRKLHLCGRCSPILSCL